MVYLGGPLTYLTLLYKARVMGDES